MLGTTLSSLIPMSSQSDTILTPSEAVSTPYKVILYVSLFLIALGCGGVRSSLLPLGADQFTDTNHSDQQKKVLFFSWFYVCVIFGVISSGTVVVWVQENVSWSLGFGISTLCIGLALVWFLAGTSTYRRRVPCGSPLKSICQVLVASFRKIWLDVPKNGTDLYKACYMGSNCKVGSQMEVAQTSDFRYISSGAC
jgi:solute carrier family 15 (peptide/histidine transporter), member 3/4